MNNSIELSIEKAQSILSDIEFPAKPNILIAIMSEKNKPNPNINKIANEISQDIALSAATLKTVNSPFFGLIKKITSIQQGVMLLGLTNLFNIVTSVSLKNVLKVDDKDFMEKFWDTLNEVAMTSTFLTRKFTSIPIDKAYLLGLFHDCGALILMKKFKDYKDLYDNAKFSSEKNLTEIETQRYGTNHCVVGYMLAKSWQLPEFVTDGVFRHHEYMSGQPNKAPINKESETLIHILNMSTYLRNKFYNNYDENDLEEYLTLFKNYFQITDEQFAPVIKDVFELMSL